MASAGREEQQRESKGSEFVYDYVCQPCQTDGKIHEAEGLCTDCQEYLCKRCYDCHTIPTVTRHHVLLDKQQMLNRKIPMSRKDKSTEKCPHHADEIIKYYCKNHSYLGCNVCITMQHRSCKGVEYIPYIANDLKNSREFTEFETQLTSIDNRLKNADYEIKWKIKVITKRYTDAQQALREYRKEINDAFDKIETEINERAEQMKSEQMKKLTNISKDFNTTKTEVQDLISKVEALQKGQQNCNLYIIAMQSKGMLKSLNDKLTFSEDINRIKGCKFKPNEGLLEMLKRPEGMGKLCEVGPITGIKLSADINVRSSTDKETCFISGCTILPDNKSIVVADFRNCNIKMCSINQGAVISELKLQNGPWDITNTSDSQVAVTAPSQKKILFIKPAQNLTVNRDLEVNGQCRGVAKCRDGRLIVSFDGPHKVEIMKLDGTVLLTIANDSEGNPLFNNSPSYVTISPDNTVMYVSNLNTGVVCLRLDGSVVAAYKDWQLSMQAVVDGDGMFYVCGRSSHSIHQVTRDCREVKVLMTSADEIKDPWSICYNETDEKFYVGMNNSDKLKVFLALHDTV